ncbi:hypothetical protein JCM19231_2983 [Vibrio ishigakensis]|uniref:Uncharacterized protein n=1 Tax=Vibrio ishigakensis TaxID=1481914 RepID=A0A0B8NNM9_9VIBR|nr:hypothetical protein JCM19231_2983 [Vibrio ishigakensis]
MSDLISFADDYQGESGYFWEGAILASNLTVKPLEPENWAADLFGEDFEQAKRLSLSTSMVNLPSSRRTSIRP